MHVSQATNYMEECIGIARQMAPGVHNQFQNADLLSVQCPLTLYMEE